MASTSDLAEAAAEELGDRLRGSVLGPGDEGYRSARGVWNARIDRRPAVVVRSRGTADVLETVRFANRHDTVLSVKGGGHHVSGSAVPNGGIMLDLGAMDGVRVDPDDRTLRVGPGARWGQVDHETLAFDLAVPGGQDPDIGVAGLTLGGGVGWLSRKFGLTCDNLLSADVVTARGELVHASPNEHPDLFWSLRGGGGAAGIVTSFEFRLHPVGPSVFAGSLVYPLEDFAAAANYYRDFMSDAPREARLLLGSMVLPPASIYPEEVHDTRVAMIIACYVGDPGEGRRRLDHLRERADPITDTFRERSYLEWQGVGRSRGRLRTYVRSQYLRTLTDASVETIEDSLSVAPSMGATVFASPRGGAETDPSVDATAYPHREDVHHVLVETRWEAPDGDDEHVRWTREFAAALEPHTTGATALNFLTEDEPIDRIRGAFGENLDRLLDVVSTWDPYRRLRMNPHLERIRTAAESTDVR